MDRNRSSHAGAEVHDASNEAEYDQKHDECAVGGNGLRKAESFHEFRTGVQMVHVAFSEVAKVGGVKVRKVTQGVSSHHPFSFIGLGRCPEL